MLNPHRSLLGSSYVGRSRSLFMKYGPTLVLRLNGNGRIWLFCERLLPFWGCFHWLPFSLTSCWALNHFLFVRLLGIPKPCQLFQIPSLLSVNVCGLSLFLTCRLQNTIW